MFKKIFLSTLGACICLSATQSPAQYGYNEDVYWNERASDERNGIFVDPRIVINGEDYIPNPDSYTASRWCQLIGYPDGRPEGISRPKGNRVAFDGLRWRSVLGNYARFFMCSTFDYDPYPNPYPPRDPRPPRDPNPPRPPRDPNPPRPQPPGGRQCDARTQPAPHYGMKNGICMPSCGHLAGPRAIGKSDGRSCEQHGLRYAGEAYDVQFCCLPR